MSTQRARSSPVSAYKEGAISTKVKVPFFNLLRVEGVVALGADMVTLALLVLPGARFPVSVEIRAPWKGRAAQGAGEGPFSRVHPHVVAQGDLAQELLTEEALVLFARLHAPGVERLMEVTFCLGLTAEGALAALPLVPGD